jgi:pseudouridine-5'-phosphate glycosidase
LNKIQTQPIETAKEMISRLSIEDEIRKIGDILMMTSDEEMIAKRLTNYVLENVDKISRKEELDRNVRLLKELIA